MSIQTKILVVVVFLMLGLGSGAAWAAAQNSPTSFGDLTCTTGQIAKFTGTAWACADDLTEMQAQLDALALKLDPVAEFTKVVYDIDDAVKANDLDRLMSYYADDVVTILPGVPPLVGKDAVRADWENFFNTYELERDSKLVYVNVDDHSAVRRMEWTNTLTPKAGGDTIVDTGNCIVGFKKVGNDWKIAWEMAASYPPSE